MQTIQIIDNSGGIATYSVTDEQVAAVTVILSPAPARKLSAPLVVAGQPNADGTLPVMVTATNDLDGRSVGVSAEDTAMSILSESWSADPTHSASFHISTGALIYAFTCEGDGTRRVYSDQAIF